MIFASAAQTKEISKATKADPTASGRLVDKAKRSSMKGLKDERRKTMAAPRSAQSEAARHDRIHRSRYCRTWIDVDVPGGDDRGGDDPAGDDPASRGGPQPPATPDGDGPLRPHGGGGAAGPPATVIAVISHGAVTNGSDIRSVAHADRQVTARQRSAWWSAIRICVVPGCAESTGLEIVTSRRRRRAKGAAASGRGYAWSAAARRAARSIFRMPSMAFMARWDRPGSGSLSISSIPGGHTCQDRP